jgi:hypothetical protein
MNVTLDVAFDYDGRGIDVSLHPPFLSDSQIFLVMRNRAFDRALYHKIFVCGEFTFEYQRWPDNRDAARPNHYRVGSSRLVCNGGILLGLRFLEHQLLLICVAPDLWCPARDPERRWRGARKLGTFEGSSAIE